MMRALKASIPMARRVATLTLAAALLSGPVLAQDAETPANAPIPRNGHSVQTGKGTPLAEPGAGTLPGVGLDVTAETEQRAPEGPGGLQNGVGAEGVMTPDSTGSSGTVGQTPGAPADPGQNPGIPLGTDG